jgi:uncharacterized membrane protein
MGRIETIFVYGFLMNFEYPAMISLFKLLLFLRSINISSLFPMITASQDLLLLSFQLMDIVPESFFSELKLINPFFPNHASSTSE